METLSDIGVFVRVVEQRSFTRAGQLLGLSASGVSRVISRLETRLGAQLLARSTRSVGLTADGVGYYESCLRILRELEDANGRLGGTKGEVRGRLRVDAPSVLGRFVIAPAVPAFLAKHPGLTLELKTCPRMPLGDWGRPKPAVPNHPAAKKLRWGIDNGRMELIVRWDEQSARSSSDVRARALAGRDPIRDAR